MARFAQRNAIPMVPAAARPPAVAGTFYPGSPDRLGSLVDRLLAEAAPPVEEPAPKALIVPHAGYVYSGAVAASAFARLCPDAATIRRIVLLGPAHRVFVHGVVSPGVAVMRTPLGDVDVDLDAIALVRALHDDPEAHALEHSLEVQLPFLRRVVPNARVVPLAIGRATTEEVARVIDRLWGGPETRIVVSSDLSHYLPYDTAAALDSDTAVHIVAMDGLLSPSRACGYTGVNGLIHVARARRLHAKLLDLRNSGDTAGDKDAVVGYGAFGFYEEPPCTPSRNPEN